jgi:hypothetical protein
MTSQLISTDHYTRDESVQTKTKGTVVYKQLIQPMNFFRRVCSS